MIQSDILTICIASPREAFAFYRSAGRKTSGLQERNDRVRVAVTGYRNTHLANAPRKGNALIAGTAGAIAPELRPGDLFIASKVMGTGGGVICPDPELFTRLKEALDINKESYHEGLLMSVKRAVTTTVERNAHLDNGVSAVDMESYDLMKRLKLRNCPSAAIRIISDQTCERAQSDYRDRLEALNHKLSNFLFSLRSKWKNTALPW